MEDGIVVEAGVARGPDGGHALADQAGGIEQTLLADILVDRAAGLLLEEAHEMVAAEEDAISERVDGEIGGEIFVDVGEGLADLLVRGTVGGRALGGGDAVDGDQELGDQCITHGVRAGALVREGFFEGSKESAELFALLIVRKEEAAACAVGRAEAVHEAGGGEDALEKAGVEVENDTLVRRGDVDESAVDGMVADQEDGPGLEGVDGVFDGIVDVAREQEDDFVEIMEVEAALLAGGIAEVKIVVAFVEVAFFAYVD